MYIFPVHSTDLFTRRTVWTRTNTIKKNNYKKITFNHTNASSEGISYYLINKKFPFYDGTEINIIVKFFKAQTVCCYAFIYNNIYFIF